MTEQELKIALENEKEWRKLSFEQNKALFQKMDELNKNFSTYKEHTSSRMTKMEVKSGLIGALTALLSTIGIHLWK